MRKLIGLGLLSAATLLLQVALTRIFSIAQFYHFAFLVVSLALLGFGASGSLLALWPSLRQNRCAALYALGFGVTTVLAYLFVNHQPFDSYSIAWDRWQAYLLIANLLALAVLFGFAGALIGSMLSEAAGDAGHIYGVNLLGSAAGAIGAPLFINWLGSERTVLVCAILAGLAAVSLADQQRRITLIASGGIIAGLILLIIFPVAFEVRPSPYKALSQFRRTPDAKLIATDQNETSRLDIVDSPTIHSAQGLSLSYLGELPPQYGLLLDGDNLLPVSEASRTPENLLLALPVSVAYAIRPEAEALVLDAGGGMDVLAALANGARHVTAVEPNELVYQALTVGLREWAGLADNPRVSLRYDEIRTFTQQADSPYGVVELALTDNYRPITSGAFTLTENYTLTVEAFRAYLDLCGDDGLLVVNRWLQSTPSESLRVLALVLEALDSPDPLQHIVVFRSFQMATFIVRPTPFTPEETQTLLEAITQLRYDLVLAPVMPEEMINRYAVLETPIYHDTFLALATTPDRARFYADYVFEIRPPTDDKPFFFHFFRWEQTPDVIENLGRRWQPFGGSGYFVLLALLAFAVMAAVVFVILPIALRRRFRQALRETGGRRSIRTLGYFATIGLAFLLVEVSLIQQYILILGRPTLALATVIGALLVASGIGSSVSHRLPWRYTMGGLAVVLVIYPLIVNGFTPLLLSFPLILRLLATALLIAPVGLLMGVPFPKGITALEKTADLIPWAWAVNGSASVISAVLAVVLALSLGFTPVLIIGGGLYLLAGLLAVRVD